MKNIEDMVHKNNAEVEKLKQYTTIDDPTP
jgi:hypothetical protein